MLIEQRRDRLLLVMALGQLPHVAEPISAMAGRSGAGGFQDGRRKLLGQAEQA
jgi:hypothetical protein